MNQYLLHEYLPAFANTGLVELGIAVFFGFWTLRQIGVVALVNLLTHPALHLILWATFWGRGSVAPVTVLLFLEVMVVVIEGALLKSWLRLPTAKALIISAAMNTISGLLGLLLGN